MSPSLYMDVVAKYEDRGLESASLGFIGCEIASNDPDYAISLAQRIPPGKTRRRVFGDIAERWAKSEPVAAAEWASSIADPKGSGSCSEQSSRKMTIRIFIAGAFVIFIASMLAASLCATKKYRAMSVPAFFEGSGKL